MKGVYILNYYVYLHRKKTTGEVFYVGKGCEMRAWISSGRNEFWKRVVDKHGLVVEIYMDNLQEWYAYELEEELVLKLGRRCDNTGELVNLAPGGQGGVGSGLDHPLVDKNEYDFLNIETMEVFTGTRRALKIKYGVNTNALFHTGTTSKNWTCLEGKTKEDIDRVCSKQAGKYNPRADQTVYNFENKKGEIFIGTRLDFQEKKGFPVYHLFGINRSLIVKGWFLSENKDEILKDKRSQKEYTFRHLDGTQVRSTRWKFEEDYGVSLKNLFSIKKTKYAKGWEWVKDDCSKNN